MRTFIQWEDNSPYTRFGAEFKSDAKKRAVALWKKHRKAIEVRQGNMLVAALFVSKNKVVFKDTTGYEVTL